MRKFSFIFFIILILACNNDDHLQRSYTEFYQIHEHDENVTTFNMFPFIFKLFIDNSDNDLNETVDGIETISFLINENTDEKFIKDLNRHVPEILYTTFLQAKDNNVNIRFLAKENENYVNELIIIAEEGNNCVIINIEGSFKKENLKAFSEKINVDEVVKYRL